MKRPALEESVIEVIAADSDIPPLEKRELTRDFRYTFYSKSSDAQVAEADLRQAIEIIVTDQELARQLDEYERDLATRHQENWMSEEEWTRHQRIHSQRREYSQRIQEYKANQEELLAA